MFSGSFLVTLCLVGAVMSASLNGTVNNNSDVHDHDDHNDHNSDMHEHDSNAKIFLSLLINSTASNSTSNNSTSKPKVRDVDDVKSLNDSSEFDALNSTERTAANATNQLRRRQVDVKALNDTDALNSTKAGNETSQLRGIIIIKNRDVDEEDEEDFLLEGPEGIEADDNNSTTRRPKLRDLDDVILKALNATEEDDEEDADNSTNKAWSNSRLQERAATLNASLTSSNETRLNSTDMAATNKTVRAAGNETLNGTDSQVNATTTTTASPWSILPFFRDLTKAKEEVNDTKEAVDKLSTRSVFIVETLNDDIEDDASLDAEPDSEPSEEDRSASSNSTTTAHPQDEN